MQVFQKNLCTTVYILLKFFLSLEKNGNIWRHDDIILNMCLCLGTTVQNKMIYLERRNFTTEDCKLQINYIQDWNYRLGIQHTLLFSKIPR